MASTTNITPCLWFNMTGQEAAEFYCSVFPNSKITETTYYGPDMPVAEGEVLTVAFELDGVAFTALNAGPEFTFSEAVSFQVTCQDQAEVDHYWTALSAGGEEGPCGWLKDRFGLSWQVVPTRLLELTSDPDPARAARATQAMMQMKKIDIAELERAADG
ncbi:3-demethylubiquinone-9 3-methyltransferase [Alloactinosynnema sp. L-07]|uniref:VOC family protein n=1 Tax=Alloactinosynnema sp. L-07 TaxID=1653480 RepID=UPI00065EFC71|nr:VOC family protein [Alloactinosynnema sp. L-07]CRK61584.1 3-demethylubiquinone-9 3-methyltransferase [Alloactinosynnema sp. L-07]